MDAGKVLNNLLIIIVLISSITIAFTVGYIMSVDNNQVEKNPDIGVVEKQDETTIDLNENSTLVKALSEKVLDIYTNNEFSHYMDYFYKQDTLELDSADSKFKLSLASESLDSSIFDVTDEGRYMVISEEEIKESYESLFGLNTYQRGDFYNAVFTFIWSEQNQDYRTLVLNGLGGATCGGVQTDFAYAKQIKSSLENKIEIYEYFYVADCGENIQYYSDYNKTNLIMTSSSISKEEMLEKYSNQLGIYKYTFVEDINGIYVFTRVEKVK